MSPWLLCIHKCNDHAMSQEAVCHRPILFLHLLYPTFLPLCSLSLGKWVILRISYCECSAIEEANGFLKPYIYVMEYCLSSILCCACLLSYFHTWGQLLALGINNEHTDYTDIPLRLSCSHKTDPRSTYMHIKTSV